MSFGWPLFEGSLPAAVLQPGNLEALVLRGHAYFYLYDHDLAKRHYGEALKVRRVVNWQRISRMGGAQLIE